MKGLNKFLRYITIFYIIIINCVFMVSGLLLVDSYKITLNEILKFLEVGIIGYIILWGVILYIFIKSKSFNKKDSFKIICILVIISFYICFNEGYDFFIKIYKDFKLDFYGNLISSNVVLSIYPQLLVLLSIFCSYLVDRKKDIKRDKIIE